jgi:hypothetical protein
VTKTVDVELASRMKVQELAKKHLSIFVINETLYDELLALINEFNAWTDTVKLVKKKEQEK